MYLHGRNVLKEILKLPVGDLKIKRVLFSDQKNTAHELELLKKRCKKKGYRVEYVTPEKLYNLSREKKHQGVVIDLKEFPYTDFEKLVESAKQKPSFSIALLDMVQDPHNLGAIIRTAVAAGIKGLVITEKSSTKVTPAVVKVSTGLAFRMPISIVTNMVRAIEHLKKTDFWIYAASMEGIPYYQTNFSKKSAIILGNEGEGIRKLVKRNADYIVSIPMEPGVDSLNVSASAAVLFFELRKQLGGE
ncbi:MAG TPA: 23S rRNA (guanosine(2251)-2'-O)-methyltransferase RlmB [Kosmotoga arenicorallina]|uniref:23S rRNA (Guanosine(2251)-2'-O)-methyltransferase RlmB n=1 Tax=Kosmotoga arenicorallina TaxID=688066 RepID=A0A7C5DXN8_9BACT|nr:23S rRNA (guanosine(2251)-2'-O)-methyltransferase RlmB [Kosmotoga arenicorallina]